LIGRSHAMLGAVGYLSFVTASQLEIETHYLVVGTSVAAVLTPVFVAIPSGVQMQRTRATYFRDSIYKFFYRTLAMPYMVLLLMCAAQWTAVLAPWLIPSHPGWIVAWAAVCTGWALIPDIDEPKSTISREFGAVSQSVSNFTRKQGGGHRMITHSWIMVVATIVLGLVAALLPPVSALMFGVSFVFAIRVIMPEKAHQQSTPLMLTAALLGVMIASAASNPWPILIAMPLGVLMHDLGDWFTRAGITFWYPYRKKYGAGATPAGSPSELHFAQPFMVLLILAGLIYLAAIPLLLDPQSLASNLGMSNYAPLSTITPDDLRQLMKSLVAWLRQKN